MNERGTVRVACLGFVFDPVAQSVIREVAPPGISLVFAERQADVTERMLADSEALLVVSPVTDGMMSRAPRLRLIQKWGTGYEKIDLAAARRRGIAVAITAGANAITIAEHAIALMLSVSRSIVAADRAMRQGSWAPGELRPRSRRLYGKTIGIIGLGSIGKAVARLLRGFDVEVLYFRRSGPDPEATALQATFAPLAYLLAHSDIVTLHCPGGGTNARMIGSDAIRAMKAGAILINTARGDLIVEEDLVAALRSGHLAGAGLDVFAEEPLPPGSPLRQFDTVILTPHVAGGVMDDIAPMAKHAFGNIIRYLSGEALSPADLIVDPASGCDAPRAGEPGCSGRRGARS